MNREHETAAEARRGDPHLDTGNRALDWALARGVAANVVACTRVRVRREQRRRRAIVAGCLALAVMAFVLRPRPDAPASEAAAPALAVAAIVSGPPTHVLPDGTRIELNEGARYRLDYSAHVRRVFLDAGEAHFAVTKNPKRPFVVVVDGIEVRAVGTEFSVSRDAAMVDVVVTEGRVAIDRRTPEDPGAGAAAPGPAARTIAMLEAGKRVVVAVAAASPPLVETLSTEEQRKRLAWRVPLLDFSGTPLRDAVQLFNRHGSVRLAVHPHVGHVRLSGVLRASDTESLLLLLANEFDIVARARPDGTLELTR